MENTKLRFLSSVIKPICIVSFSWFFPCQIFPLHRVGNLLVLLMFCCRAALPAPWHAKLSPRTPSGSKLPGQGAIKVKQDHNRQYCACRAKPSAATEEPPAARWPLFVLLAPQSLPASPLLGKPLNFHAGAFLCIDQSLSHISGWDPAWLSIRQKWGGREKKRERKKSAE